MEFILQTSYLSQITEINQSSYSSSVNFGLKTRNVPHQSLQSSKNVRKQSQSCITPELQRTIPVIKLIGETIRELSHIVGGGLLKLFFLSKENSDVKKDDLPPDYNRSPGVNFPIFTNYVTIDNQHILVAELHSTAH